MQAQGTLCFLVCLFLLRDRVAMESGAETALRGGLAAGILGAAVATAFVQWMRPVTARPVTGADGDTLQEIVDEMNNNDINSAEELRDADDANM